MKLRKKFTLSNDNELEDLINFEVRFVTQVLKDLLGASLSCVWLIGGYGRGEGGVSSLSGKASPKNNYDFLVVLNNKIVTKKMRSELIKKTIDMTKGHISVPLEISLRSLKQVKRSENIMIYRDILDGSYTTYGKDPKDVLPLEREEHLPKLEALRVIRNRGMLLMASEENLEHYGYESTPQQREIWRAKAIIGYVDALLIINKKYITSYSEKNNNFQKMNLSDFLNPYEENLLKKSMTIATEYRLFGSSDITTLFDVNIMQILQKVHSYVGGRTNIELPRKLVDIKRHLYTEGGLRIIRNIIYNIVNFRLTTLPLVFVHPKDQLNFIVPYLFYKKEMPNSVKQELGHLGCREKALETYIRYLV